MEIHSLENFKGGWFVGNFEPSCYKDNYEVSYKEYQAGEHHAAHYHAVTREINLIVEGKVQVNGIFLEKKQIFVIEPMEVCTIDFLTNCSIVCVKTSSIPGDKYEV